MAEVDYEPVQPKSTALDVRAIAAEFLASFLFVLVCCGAATGVAGEDGWIQQVSLTFGLCITGMVYTVWHHSGGQINCAVSIGLMVVGELPVLQGVLNIVAQLLGSLSGAGMLALIVSPEDDKTGGLGTNTVGKGEPWQALIGEILMTFMLMYVVLETAVNYEAQANAVMAPVAIGFTVYLAHSLLIPIDGCSINPTRSFGPPVVASFRYPEKMELFWKDHWVFWVGPIVGSVLAVGFYKVHQKLPGGTPKEFAPKEFD
jgi:MIP family channel proteins